ncbi:MAG: hypothetical protein MRZ79_18060 [Bacteroidia bacterium]|nr:hypothetical protein [Bacteroidia bacterium]
MKNLLKVLLFVAFFLLGNSLFAQSELLDEVNSRRIRLNKVNMTVLGTWAIGNMVISGVRRGQTTGTQRYFHEMNVFWNVVNLGLAAGGLYGAFNENPAEYSLYDTYHQQQQIEKILLFNLALNGTYITAGAWMRERSNSFVNDQVKQDRFKGYGNSLIVQGSFLLVFDLTQFLLHHQQAAPKLQKLLEGVSVDQDGVGLLLRF